MVHYALLDNVKNKLRLTDADETLNEELEFYLSDIDNYVNLKLRSLFGRVDHQGRDIILPLTEETNPPIDDGLISRAVDLAIGLFRKQQNNEEKLWENAVVDFETYLTDRFGWARDRDFRFTTPPLLTVQGSIPNRKLPDGTVKDFSKYIGEGEFITVNGFNFTDFKKLLVTFGGKGSEGDPDPLVTLPNQVDPGWFSDELGNFRGNQIQIPPGVAGNDENVIRVLDGGTTPGFNADGTEIVNEAVSTIPSNEAQIRVFVIPKSPRAFAVDAVLA